jgi:ATP synthase protein I
MMAARASRPQDDGESVPEQPDSAVRPDPTAPRSPAGSAWRYGRPAGKQIEADSRSKENAGWTLFGYLLSGMAVYGGIGWLAGRWTGIPLLFPAGLFVGLGAAILLIVLKYGRA